jgi:phospho-N-acetylmuramoyl-pentapeptide-transferase
MSMAFNFKVPTNYPSMLAEVKIILFAFVSFAFLGVYDDLNKIFFWKKSGFFGLRMKHKLIIEIVLAFILAYWLYSDLGISIIHIPFFGVFDIGIFYILFAAFVIVSFSNAVNFTDGLDGLAGGILLFSLLTFWVVARSILDVPTSLFIASWVGGLMAFLYFNMYPSRIFLGDAGALSFGATFAVIGLILGKVFALPIVGGIFLIEILTSALQLLSKRFLKKKLFPVAPLHLWLQLKGWEEPKIVMRLWLISIIFSLLGLMIAFLK